MRLKRLPVALTIAGSDSGGGAGIQADLKTFGALGVHGTSVVTCLTAQNPAAVLAIQPCASGLVRQQLEAVFAQLPPAGMKTGMLYSRAIVRVVVDFLRQHRLPPLIVDPVMVATSGAPLLTPAAWKCLRAELLPLAALVTPNLAEAEILTGRTLSSADDLRAAAREIHRRYGCAALVKGGHLPRLREAVDFFCDGHCELLLSAPYVKGARLHGTGCTYAAAIAAYCALGRPLPKAVALAKRYVAQAITDRRCVRHYEVLHHFC